MNRSKRGHARADANRRRHCYPRVIRSANDLTSSVSHCSKAVFFKTAACLIHILPDRA
jgi:hypothetical protein